MENWTGNLTMVAHLESYTVVISVTALLLSAIFGMAGSLLLLIALCMSKSTRTLTYCLFGSVLLVGCLFACIWIPSEIVQLLQYYLTGTLDHGVKFTIHSLHLLLLNINMLTIVLISTKNINHIACRERNLFHQKILFVCLLGSWLASIGIATAYGILSAYNENQSGFSSYQLMRNLPAFHFKIVLLTCHILILLVVLTGLVLTSRLKTIESDDRISDGESDTQAEMSTCLPTIQEPPNLEPLGEGLIGESLSAASTPRSQKNKVIDKAAEKKIRDEKIKLDDLPGASKRKSSLQVNLANLLNRRRHTICQIGSTGAPTDGQGKPVQYNYVRKFSVDVMALQAQLENPKVHGGSFPFQSDQNLAAQSQKSLNGSLIKDSKASLPSIQEAENEGAIEVLNQVTNLTFLSEQFEKRKSSEERHFHDKLRQLRFCILTVVTYLCCVLPLYIAEVLRGVISVPAYINTITCVTAFSLLQIIIYPYLFLCMDKTMHKITHKLLRNIQQRWSPQEEESPVRESTTETNATQL